jgi:hypothetical protein
MIQAAGGNSFAIYLKRGGNHLSLGCWSKEEVVESDKPIWFCQGRSFSE